MRPFFVDLCKNVNNGTEAEITAALDALNRNHSEILFEATDENYGFIPLPCKASYRLSSGAENYTCTGTDYDVNRIKTLGRCVNGAFG